MRAGTTNEKGRCARIFHLIVRILTLPPIVIGITVLLMYVPAKIMTLRELLLCELFLLLIHTVQQPNHVRRMTQRPQHYRPLQSGFIMWKSMFDAISHFFS